MITIRTILPEDNSAIASTIRNTLAEFGANKPGTAYFDSATDDMFASFQIPGSRYHVGLIDGQVGGGGGIYPSAGLPDGVCEMVKMYLSPQARGKGLGRQLIEECLSFAQSHGYAQVYIETMPELQKAVSIYEKFGFQYLDGPMGNTGHYGCSIWMLKKF
ncbi:MAG: GNAT family N-acetyltransferase [Bacteroidetes bacterium]|nr:GNAT family N-acetyltransferase [Bacteroidota bacterium]